MENGSGIMLNDALENFKKSWMEEIAKIEKDAIDSRNVDLIYLQYDFGSRLLVTSMNEDEEFTREVPLELEMLKPKLVRALATASSRYVLKNRSQWARISEALLESLKPLAE